MTFSCADDSSEVESLIIALNLEEKEGYWEQAGVNLKKKITNKSL